MIEKLQFITQQNEKFTHLTAMEAALKAGVKWVQLRVKDQSADVVTDHAFKAMQLCDEYGAKLIINDYPLIAKETGAAGVHLGKDDVTVDQARKILGPDKIIGGTANTVQDIIGHERNGADYIGLGPFRFTTTKKKLSPVLGLEGYRQILKECTKRGIRVPIIAIGGIEIIDIPSLLGAGVYGIAASSLIIRNDISNTIKTINEILKVEKHYA
ncbi:Thiamin-phosphate pyrophosphorylase [Fulvivirga imtechensis AK7]|uniref:Thiamine-phosphate synthase n=1 Tax=Fulvivirga imtechensis AK7 TaxID=1237149 RepID=L8JKY7_9BACT|nr:thiamine phosphate synthase [Fulvivirga imtechensis]ELR68164.1 Thiamin-phosphate pyrophosphorylase [Fulvivirga imtechensis AK7]